MYLSTLRIVSQRALQCISEKNAFGMTNNPTYLSWIGHQTYLTTSSLSFRSGIVNGNEQASEHESRMRRYTSDSTRTSR